MSRTTPKIYNAVCIQMRELDIVLYSDVVIFAKGFNFTNTLDPVGYSVPHKLWLLVPTRPANYAQRAGGTNTIDISVSVTTQSPTSVFLYTPCNINMSNLTLRGQVYGRTADLQSNATINYIPTDRPWRAWTRSSPTAETRTVDISKRETTG